MKFLLEEIQVYVDLLVDNTLKGRMPSGFPAGTTHLMSHNILGFRPEGVPLQRNLDSRDEPYDLSITWASPLPGQLM